MGAFGSHDQETLRSEEIEELVEITGFRPQDITTLYERFRSLDTSADGYITRKELLRLPELAMNPLRERILAHFQLDDRDAINFKDFVRFIAPFRKTAELDQKVRQTFEIFDEDRDGFISREELCHVLQMMGGDHISEVQADDVARKIIKEADKDGDGQLDFSEFKAALKGINMQEDFTIGPWKDE